MTWWYLRSLTDHDAHRAVSLTFGCVSTVCGLQFRPLRARRDPGLSADIEAAQRCPECDAAPPSATPPAAGTYQRRLQVSCTTHADGTDLTVTWVGGLIMLGPHEPDACGLVLDERAAATLLEALHEWEL